MPFLTPNQQRQWTEGCTKFVENTTVIQQNNSIYSCRVGEWAKLKPNSRAVTQHQAFNLPTLHSNSYAVINTQQGNLEQKYNWRAGRSNISGTSSCRNAHQSGNISADGSRTSIRRRHTGHVPCCKATATTTLIYACTNVKSVSQATWAHRVALIAVSLSLSERQLTLWDHRYGANASYGVCLFMPRRLLVLSYTVWWRALSGVAIQVAYAPRQKNTYFLVCDFSAL